jgi:mycothiol synthase
VTLQWRGYQPGDGTVLAAHHNLLTEYAGGSGSASPEVMESYVSSWLRDPSSDSRLVFSGDRLVAAGLVSSLPGGSLVGLGGSVGTGRAYCGVHPQWRGRGLGRELLQWQLMRAQQLHDAVAVDGDWEVHVGAPSDDERAAHLFQRQGLTPSRYWFEMVAPTTPSLLSPPPDGLRVTSYQEKYEQNLHAVHMASFTDHWGFQPRDFARWAPVTVRSDMFLPALSRLALAGDEVVGFVLCYRSAAGPDRLHIGQGGTLAAWRRRGVSTGLFADILHAAHEAGYTSVDLQVDSDSPTGALAVDERVGFRTRYRVTTYATLLPAAAMRSRP